MTKHQNGVQYVTRNDAKYVRNSNLFNRIGRSFIKELIESKTNSISTQNTFIMKFIEDIIKYSKYTSTEMNNEDKENLFVITEFSKRLHSLFLLINDVRKHNTTSTFWEKIYTISNLQTNFIQ